MIAGRLKYRLTLLRPAGHEGIYGEDPLDFEPYGVVWGERVKYSPQSLVETQERWTNVRAEFNIRLAHPVATGWRLRVNGNTDMNLYEVTGIIPNVDRGMMTLICERVNQ